MKKYKYILISFLLLLLSASCAKPMIDGRVIPDVEYQSETYAAVPNDAYYAIRWAMEKMGYAVAEENLAEGFILSTWIPIKSDSHYIPFFGRKDYGATGSYYRLRVQVVPDEGRTRIKIGSEAKSLVSNLKSSGIEEKNVLVGIGDYLRKASPDISNLGINE